LKTLKVDIKQGLSGGLKMTIGNLLATTDLLWKLMEAYSLDPEQLFEKAGVSRKAIKTAGTRVPFDVVNRLWREAAEMIDDPCFGLRAAEFWHPSHMHALGYAWLSSRTLREAFNRYTRYSRIISAASEIELEDSAAGFVVSAKPSPEIGPRPNRADAFFACLIKMCRMNYGSNLNPVAVFFTRDEPACLQAYQDIFKAPVEFGAERNGFTLPEGTVDQDLVSDSPQMARLHDRVIIKYLANLEKGDLVHRVKAAIIDRLPSGEASQQAVAPLVGMSVRSLQRRLKALDTSFQKLLDETRSELAHNYIRDIETDLTEIAFNLGFSEHSAFSRAFKRWTGKSPKQTRETLPA
jgi:AraC-like DNA-binding protein